MHYKLKALAGAQTDHGGLTKKAEVMHWRREFNMAGMAKGM